MVLLVAIVLHLNGTYGGTPLEIHDSLESCYEAQVEWTNNHKMLEFELFACVPNRTE